MSLVAEVIPLAKRLPAQKGVFDYSVPENLEAALRVGEIVEIPFRTSTRLGLILRIKEMNEARELRPIIKRITRTPLLFSHELSLLTTLASWYGVSPAIIAHLMLPPLQKRKLASVKTTIFEYEQTESLRPNIVLTRTLEETVTLLLEIEKKQEHTVVFFPEIFRLEHFIAHLPENLARKLVVWHSALSPKEEFSAWEKIRLAETPLLIFATRGGAFLPFPPHTHILLTDEGHEEYKHWDQNPRFHVKDVLEIRRKETPLPLTLCGRIPSLESYIGIYEKTLLYPSQISKQDRLFSEPTLPELTVIDMNEERRAGRYTTLSDEVKEIVGTADGDILLLVQRRGFMGTVGCTACKNMVRCSTCQNPLVLHENTNTLLCHYCGTHQEVPSLCPTCNRATIRYGNAGTAFIEQGIRSLVSENQKVAVYRIDGDTGEQHIPDDDKYHVVVGTEKALPHLRREKTKAIIFVDLDSILHVPEYQMNETIWQSLHDMALLFPNAKIYAQTSHKEHIVFTAHTEPDRFYRTELSARKSLNYPPYTTMVRFLLSGREKVATNEKAKQMADTIRLWLTNEGKSGTIQGPFEMHPHFYRHEFWYTLIIRIPNETKEKMIPKLAALLTPGWRVDIRPNSVLRF